MAIAVAQFTIFDFHDVQSSPAPPSNPVKEQIWLDTSVHPPFMKVWDGNKWVIANDYSNDINNNKETIKTHTTDISVIKGNITTLIKDTTIVKDGKTILLKDDYNRTVQTVDSMKSTIGNHTTQINQATGDITKVESKVNTVERDLNNISLRVSSTESTTVSLSNQVNKAQNDANTANSKIDNLEIGGRNLALNTESNFSNPYNSFTGVENTCPFLAKVLTDGLRVGDKITVRLIYKYIDIVATPGKISKCWIQGSGDVTNWNSGSFQGSPQITLSGSGEHEFLYTFTINSDHIKNKYWNLNIRHDFVQSGSVQWKMFKVEHGTKYTDWTPAPEDIRSSIKDIDNKITTTNNKVSIIKTNLNSITSRVSSVETTTSTINGQVSNLSTRMNSAEQKITDSSIVATVSSQFYKKGEADSRYASKTQISQLENQITSTVETFETMKIGTYNMIKNPTALLNKDKWGAFLGANCKIERVSINIESIKELPTRVHFIDIGDGLCVLVESNGKFALIDTGKLGTAINKGSLEYIKSLGVEDIDYFIITHHHSDHNGECERFLNNFNVKNVYTRQPDWSKMPAVETQWQTKVYFDRFYNKLKSQGKNFITPTERQTLWMSDECALEIFNTNFNNYAEYNDLSFGVLVRVGSRRLFIAGDISYNAEASLRGRVGKVDYLCGGHHAYNTSNSDAWLDELSPTTCIFTSENIKGSSQSTVVNRVKSHGIEVYATNLDGTIVVTMDSKNISHNATHAV